MSHREDSGFTLIELMIVVAIIGILASLAIPNFLLLQCKSKQSEAKMNLASIFTNEKGFFAEYNTYGTDLVYLGWQPGGSPLYLYGWSSANYPTLPVAGAPGFDGTRDNTLVPSVIGNPAGYSTAKMVDLAGATLGVSSLPAGFLTGSTFQVGAVGDIFPDSAVITDQWTIDSEKSLNVIINDCEGN